jgi:hypothetical protein
MKIEWRSTKVNRAQFTTTTTTKNKQKGSDDAEQAALPSTGTAALPSVKLVFL